MVQQIQSRVLVSGHPAVHGHVYTCSLHYDLYLTAMWELESSAL